jgi:hypothetical protein
MHRSLATRESTGRNNGRLRSRWARNIRNRVSVLDLDPGNVPNNLKHNIKSRYNKNLTNSQIRRIAINIQRMNENATFRKLGLNTYNALFRNTPELASRAPPELARLAGWFRKYINSSVNNINWNAYIKNSVSSIKPRRSSPARSANRQA